MKHENVVRLIAGGRKTVGRAKCSEAGGRGASHYVIQDLKGTGCL